MITYYLYRSDYIYRNGYVGAEEHGAVDNQGGGASRQMMSRIVVEFPEPLGPENPVTTPGAW
jgi:hypothetical protein